MENTIKRKLVEKSISSFVFLPHHRRKMVEDESQNDTVKVTEKIFIYVDGEQMITEAYNTDSLRKIIRSLECENRILKEKLRSAGIPFSSSNPFEDKAEEQKDFDPDQGGRIIFPDYISDDMTKRFFAVFWGRQDVYAKRGKMGDIIRNAVIVGMISFVPNAEVKKLFAMDVSIENGFHLSYGKSKNT